MTPALLLRMLSRLEASPLPPFDPVRLELARELTELTTRIAGGESRYVVRVHDDAQGDLDLMDPLRSGRPDSSLFSVT
jgi:hypothetical protein